MLYDKSTLVVKLMAGAPWSRGISFIFYLFSARGIASGGLVSRVFAAVVHEMINFSCYHELLWVTASDTYPQLSPFFAPPRRLPATDLRTLSPEMRFFLLNIIYGSVNKDGALQIVFFYCAEIENLLVASTMFEFVT